MVSAGLPEVEGDKAKKQKFATYPIGYFHIHIAEVQTEDGKLYMFVAVDRASKFAYAELHPRATRTMLRKPSSSISSAPPRRGRGWRVRRSDAGRRAFSRGSPFYVEIADHGHRSGSATRPCAVHDR
jgi:hypothetical protein